MLKVTKEWQPDGYRQLLAAVLLQAWQEATGRNPYRRAVALAWLHSPGAEMACEWLGLNVDALRAGVGGVNRQET